MADLDTIEPDFLEVTLTSHPTVVVRPITVGQLPRFLKAIKPIIDSLAKEGTSLSDLQEGELEVDMLALYVEHGERLNDAIAISTGLPPKVVEALGLDEGILLAKAVWEVNADFFARRVLPLIAQGQPPQANGLGPTPSPSS